MEGLIWHVLLLHLARKGKAVGSAVLKQTVYEPGWVMAAPLLNEFGCVQEHSARNQENSVLASRKPTCEREVRVVTLVGYLRAYVS